MKNKIITNMIWRFMESVGHQLVTFIVSIFLARLLGPSDYGTIALVTVFTSILQVFVDSGLGNALIQKEDVDELDFSSVFYANMVFCVVLYSCLFVIAPWIADFYKQPELISITRALGLTLIFSGAKNIQQAYVSRHLLFKKLFYSSLSGTVLAAVVGISMAYMGYGVWALVAQQLVKAVVNTLVLWFFVKWRPRAAFSFKRLKPLISYGWKLLCSQLINTIYSDIRTLLIGRLYSTTDLALYNKGRNFPDLIIKNTNKSINSVLFPSMSRAQSDKEKLRSMTRTSIRCSSYLIWPAMMGIAVIAEPFIRLLLTEKWIMSVPYTRIFCIGLAFEPIHAANLNAIKALGRSDIYLKLEIIKKSLGLVILFIVLPYGPYAICCSTLVYSLIAQIINTFPNIKLLNYSYLQQLKDIFPFITMSLVMCIPCVFIGRLGLPDFISVILQVLTGIAVYVGESVLFKIDTFYFLKDKLSGILQTK